MNTPIESMDQRLIGGRYELRRRIGTGGMAEVYLATDQLLGREVALKVLNHELAADPEFVARFKREAQASASLNHPNIVAVYDYGSVDVLAPSEALVDGMGAGPSTGGPHPPALGMQQLSFIVMEYVPGPNVKEVLRQRGHLPEAEALGIAEQIAAGLDTAHRNGVIHRDVKPHNVLVDPHGVAKVTDFGIARATGVSQLTETTAVLGTAHYISPEQAQRQPTDGRSDLYSLGVVLYELLTGRLPFNGDSVIAVAWQHVHNAPPPPRGVQPGVSPLAEGVVLKALAKDPAERYQSAAEMRTALQAAREQLLSAAVPSSDVTQRFTTGQLVQVQTRTAERTVTPTTAPELTATRTAVRPPALRVDTPHSGRRVGSRPRLVALLAIAVISMLAASVGLARAAGMFGTPSSRGTVQVAQTVPGTPVPVPTTPAAEPTPVPTAVPPTAVPPTAVPPTAVPPTAVPVVPTAAPPRPTAVPPTVVPPTAVPPTVVPPRPTVEPPAPTAAPAPAPPAAEAAPASTGAASPSDAIVNFYQLLVQGQFDQAAQLWTPRMRALFPPAQHIVSRFAQTQQLTLRNVQVVSLNEATGRATVAVDLVEVVKGSPPTTRRIVGTWQIVRGPSGWLLDQPALQFSR